MKTLIPKILVVLALISIAGALPARAQACLDKRQIQVAVSSGEIQSLGAVLTAAGIGRNAEVLSVQVCEQRGRLVYVIGVLLASGEARNLTLSAQ